MSRYALHKWLAVVAFVGVVAAGLAAILAAAPAPRPQAPSGGKPAAAAAAPVLVIETPKGTIEFETFPGEAPKTVAHIVALVRKNFYNGQRFHRVEPGFVVQFGDQQTRDVRKKANWGRAGSGSPIGVSEISPLHKHTRGAVSMANGGDPASADSQMFIVLNTERARHLDGKHTVFGRVTSGMAVVDKIAKDDPITRVSIKGAASGLGAASRGSSSPAAKPTPPAK